MKFNLLASLTRLAPPDAKTNRQLVIGTGLDGSKQVIASQAQGQSLRFERRGEQEQMSAQDSRPHHYDIKSLSIADLKALNSDNLKLFIDDFVDINRVELKEIRQSFEELADEIVRQRALANAPLHQIERGDDTALASNVEVYSMASDAVEPEPIALSLEVDEEALRDAQNSHLQAIAETLGQVLQSDLENIVKAQGLSHEELSELVKEVALYGLEEIGVLEGLDSPFVPDMSALVERVFTNISAEIAAKDQTVTMETKDTVGNGALEAMADKANDGGEAMRAFAILTENFKAQGKDQTQAFLDAVGAFQLNRDQPFDKTSIENLLMVMFEMSQDEDGALFDDAEKRVIEMAARSLVQFVDQAQMLSPRQPDDPTQTSGSASTGSIFDSLMPEREASQRVYETYFKDEATLNNRLFDHFMAMDRVDLSSLLADPAAYSELFFAETVQAHLDIKRSKSFQLDALVLSSSQSTRSFELKNATDAEAFEWPLPEKPGYVRVDKSWATGVAGDHIFVSQREADQIALLRDTMKFIDAQNQAESIKLWEDKEPGIVDRVTESLKAHRVSDQATDREFLFFNRLYRHVKAESFDEEKQVIDEMRHALARLGVKQPLPEYINSNGRVLSGTDFEPIPIKANESGLARLNQFKNIDDLTTKVDLLVSSLMELDLSRVMDKDPLEAILGTALATMDSELLAELSVNFDNQTNSKDRRMAEFRQQSAGHDFLAFLSMFNDKLEKLLEVAGNSTSERPSGSEALSQLFGHLSRRENKHRVAYAQAYLKARTGK